MTALAKQEAVQSKTLVTPLEMIDRALSQNAGIEVLEKLMTLQERWDRNEARKEFDQAVALAKANIKPIPKNRLGHNGKKYADIAAIAKEVDPVIAEHGLSYRFRTRQDDRIYVTCILSHRAGHCEETTLAGAADVSGNKNSIQAIGSTLTYLQRYSLVQMLGLAVEDDDDGHGAGIRRPQPAANVMSPNDSGKKTSSQASEPARSPPNHSGAGHSIPDHTTPQHDEDGVIIEPVADAADQPVAPVGGPAGATGSLSVEDMGRQAAMQGRDMFDIYYAGRNADEKKRLRAIKPELERLFPKQPAAVDSI